jgi:site-specific recombinase
VLGIALIAMVNLLVSFGLALWVALRARKIRFYHGFKLLRALGRAPARGAAGLLYRAEGRSHDRTTRGYE